MAASKNPGFSQEYVRARLHYNKKTGVFIWKYCTSMPLNWNRRYAGTVAGCNHAGYVKIALLKSTRAFAHNLAWLYVKGEWPAFEIDHKDGNPANNSWKNLRKASRSQQLQNARRRSHNTSGTTGVSWNSRKRCWLSRITVDKKRHLLGVYKKKSDAVKARQAAEPKFFKKFCRAA